MRPISLQPSTCCLALRHSSMTAAIHVLNSMKNLSILGRPISLNQYIEVKFLGGRRHLPVVSLRRAA